MSHSAVGGWFLRVLIGAAKMRGQDKNNADISDYGGRWNHPEDRIFPSYLANITSACKASWYISSLLPYARADKHSDYVPQFEVLLSAPCHAALPSALLLCLHTFIALSVYHPAAPSIHSSMDFMQH